MSHRIELASTGRAGCTDKVCKDNGTKIAKGELRLGSWVEIPTIGHGSWKWRHWGCVSGAQIENIRDKIRMGDNEYRWDAIDGYEELNANPEVQEKIRRVIEQGHIDPVDFNGDPEYNVLGQTGIRGRAKKAKKNDDDDEDADASPSEKATPAKKTPAKRGRKKAAVDDDEEADAEPPRKRARAKKATTKKEVVKQEEDVEDEPPAKAPAKTKKEAVKQEEDVEDEPPAKAPAKTKKKAVKHEEDVEDEPPAKAPAKTKKAKREAAVKDEEDVDEPLVKATAKTKKATATKVKPEPLKDNDDEQPDSPPKKKGKAAAPKRAPRAAATKSRKKQPEPEPESEAASEPESELEDLDDADFASEIAAEENGDAEDGEPDPASEPDYAPAKPSRKGKAASVKKAASNGTRKSGRNKR